VTVNGTDVLDEDFEATMMSYWVLDNPDADFKCTWGTSGTGGYGDDYRWHAAGDGSCTATWTPNLAAAASYNVYAWWKASTNRATDAKYTIYYDGGSETVQVNQEINGSQWNLLGTFPFSAGQSGYVVLSDDANQYVIADAIKFEFLDPGDISDIMEISGQITESGFGLDGLTVELTGLMNTSTVTSGGGYYSFIVTEDGNYMVAPSLAGYEITPPYIDVTVNGTDVLDEDFEATMMSYWVLDNPDADFKCTWLGHFRHWWIWG
jgi:hypothetical protein